MIQSGGIDGNELHMETEVDAPDALPDPQDVVTEMNRRQRKGWRRRKRETPFTDFNTADTPMRQDLLLRLAEARARERPWWQRNWTAVEVPLDAVAGLFLLMALVVGGFADAEAPWALWIKLAGAAGGLLATAVLLGWLAFRIAQGGTTHGGT